MKMVAAIHLGHAASVGFKDLSGVLKSSGCVFVRDEIRHAAVVREPGDGDGKRSVTSRRLVADAA